MKKRAVDLQLCRKLNRQREAAEANKTHTANLTITFSNNTHTDTHGQAGRQSSGPETYQTLIHSLTHSVGSSSSMFRWRLPQAVCVLLACVCLVLAYEDDIEVNYPDTYYNEITDGDTPERKC